MNESVEVSDISPDMEKDVEKTIDMLNDEIMANQEFNFRGDCGIPKVQLKYKDFKQNLIPIDTEGIGESMVERPDSCRFKLVKNDGPVSRMFFGSNCRRLCKCMETYAATCWLDMTAKQIGNNTIILEFTRM